MLSIINAKTLNINLGVECYLTGILATASVSRIISLRPRPSKYVRTASSPIAVLSEINEELDEHRFLKHHNDTYFKIIQLWPQVYYRPGTKYDWKVFTGVCLCVHEQGCGNGYPSL